MVKRSRMLTTTEAARYLSVHPNTIRRWESQGLLPAFRLARRGYRRIERDSAPDDIASTTEFASVCPASSAFMMKHL